MNQSKLNYSAPEAEVFVVRYERGCCQSNPNNVVYDMGRKGYDYYDLDSDN